MARSKQTLSDLAVVGGEPSFPDPKHVGAPNIVNRGGFMERLESALDSRWLTNRGPLVQEFEEKVADLLGVGYCVATCNGTVALEIMSRALGISDEVVMPSLTFVATAHAMRWQEIRPLFADIADGYTLDPRVTEGLITPRTTAIVGVHLWGQVCDVAGLTELAERHGVALLFDAAHAFTCTLDGTYVGNFGHAEALSFHATKFLNTFEGGAIVTNDASLARRCRLMKNFGFDGEDQVGYLGINGKMSEVAAAMGLAQLERLDTTIAWNEANYEAYRDGLADLAGVSLMPYRADEQSNYQYIVIEVDEETTGISRDTVVHTLKAENVLARRYFYPGCHRMEPYRSEQPHAGLLLPETERVLDRVITLPTGTALSATEVEQITELIRFIVSHGEEVAAVVTSAGLVQAEESALIRSLAARSVSGERRPK